MKLLICDVCGGVWAYENHDEDVTIHTFCDWCRENEVHRKFEEEKKLARRQEHSQQEHF